MKINSTIIQRIADGKFVLIAEIGVNYYDVAKKFNVTPMEAAKMMIVQAHDTGIHAVKFQSYKAETLATRKSESYWNTSEESTRSQYDLFKKFDSFGEKEYRKLALFCTRTGIEFLSTAFDFESADYLDNYMNVCKISSSDITNLPFIAYQAQKNKPIILSTGASDENEIDKAIFTIRKYNNRIIIVMHCVLEYPTPFEHANLNRILCLAKKYPNFVIGYSDHTKPDLHGDIIKTAYLFGAQVIEKHFTLDKTLPGNDHYHAMDPSDAAAIIEGISFIDKIRGTNSLSFLNSEVVARQNARRSLVAKVDIKSGQNITRDMLTFKRPGTGISPSEIEKVIGKVATVDIYEDTTITNAMIE